MLSIFEQQIRPSLRSSRATLVKVTQATYRTLIQSSQMANQRDEESTRNQERLWKSCFSANIISKAISDWWARSVVKPTNDELTWV